MPGKKGTLGKKMRAAIEYFAVNGTSISEAARESGVSFSGLSNALSSPSGKKYKEDILLGKLDEGKINGLRTMRGLLNSPSDEVKFKAAKDLMDRANFKIEPEIDQDASSVNRLIAAIERSSDNRLALEHAIRSGQGLPLIPNQQAEPALMVGYQDISDQCSTEYQSNAVETAPEPDPEPEPEHEPEPTPEPDPDEAIVAEPIKRKLRRTLDAPVVNVGPKRRGRPPKDADDGTPAAPPKRRGRPPKLDENGNRVRPARYCRQTRHRDPLPNGEKRPRGRPRKYPLPEPRTPDPPPGVTPDESA